MRRVRSKTKQNQKRTTWLPGSDCRRPPNNRTGSSAVVLKVWLLGQQNSHRLQNCPKCRFSGCSLEGRSSDFGARAGKLCAAGPGLRGATWRVQAASTQNVLQSVSSPSPPPPRIQNSSAHGSLLAADPMLCVLFSCKPFWCASFPQVSEAMSKLVLFPQILSLKPQI